MRRIFLSAVLAMLGAACSSTPPREAAPIGEQGLKPTAPRPVEETTDDDETRHSAQDERSGTGKGHGLRRRRIGRPRPRRRPSGGGWRSPGDLPPTKRPVNPSSRYSIPCFSHDHVFATSIQYLQDNRAVAGARD